MPEPQPSLELQLGLESLEGIPGFSLPSAPEWREEPPSWLLPCTFQTEPGPHIPETTHWYFRISSGYPWGNIDLYPAKKGGIEVTFPHQMANLEGKRDNPWRDGKLCLSTQSAVFRQLGFGQEKRTAQERLAWHVRRAHEWLRLAVAQQLIPDGDPFELPDYSSTHNDLLVFNEDPLSMQRWDSRSATSGYVKLGCPELPEGLRVIHSFLNAQEAPIITPSWGRFFATALEEPAETGIWIRVPEVIHLEPWQAPTTWHQLHESLRSQDVHLLESLKQLVPALRQHDQPKSQRPRPPLLLGFPIPDKVGGEPVRMHWLATRLPVLAAGKDPTPGFRSNEKGYWSQDCRNMQGEMPWLRSECWADKELTGRGRSHNNLLQSRVLILGVGALGSAVAEILVRGGLRDLTLVDGDKLAAGNLVRHNLTLPDLDRPKAKALATRLNAVNPHAGVRGIDGSFPDLPQESLEGLAAIDLVLDCTASNDVLHHLANFAWNPRCAFVSLSLGLHAHRLYFFASPGPSFPEQEYIARLLPEIKGDREAHSSQEWPREGVGCWNPVFPARLDGIQMLAAAGVRQLNSSLQGPLPASQMLVFELQQEDSEDFLGITRRELPR